MKVITLAFYSYSCQGNLTFVCTNLLKNILKTSLEWLVVFKCRPCMYTLLCFVKQKETWPNILQLLVHSRINFHSSRWQCDGFGNFLHLFCIVVDGKKIEWNQNVGFCWQIWLFPSFVVLLFLLDLDSISVLHAYWGDRKCVIYTFICKVIHQRYFLLSPKICYYKYGIFLCSKSIWPIICHYH